MNVLKYINDRLIRNNAMIMGELQRHYKVYGRPNSMCKRAGVVLGLFVEYTVLKKESMRARQKKFEKQIQPESSVNRQISKQDLLKKIKNADIIIFDLWNVLIYFTLETRQLVALLEVMSGHPGIFVATDFKLLVDSNTELQKYLEEICTDFCLDNEYMHGIWDCAKLMGKNVFLYNNSDFDDEFVQKIAEGFTYTGKIYNGDLDKGLYITAGSKRKKSTIYRNVNKLGKDYRPFTDRNIVTNVYNQIINLKFHAGQGSKSIFYEYGFIYGGILVCGFCQYLNELAKQEKIDKFLFVARDGDIIKKVYDRYYKKSDTAYLYFSRNASYELMFEEIPDSTVAAEQYFMQEVRGYRHVCVVDLGWRGTSAIYLKYLLQKYGWQGKVTGALIGAVSDDITQIYVRNGILYAYAFDNEFYRKSEVSKGRCMLEEETFCIEALFSAKDPTLLRYKTNIEGKTEFVFAEENPNRETTIEIQNGIMDFAEECVPLLQKYHLKILPQDAYTPLDFCMQNRRYRKLISQVYGREKDRNV